VARLLLSHISNKACRLAQIDAILPAGIPAGLRNSNQAMQAIDR
jgi:hypothetical protein